MGTEHRSASSRSSPLWYHVGRTLVTQYWPFSIVPISGLTMGMAVAVASQDVAWDWRLWGMAAAFLLLVDQGVKSIDLSAPDINLAVDSTVQFRLGSLMVLVGFVIGLSIAYFTSWTFLIILGVLVSLAILYNFSPGPHGESPRGLNFFNDWFGGMFHDKRKFTGRMNLGLCVGGIPTVIGYFLVTETVSLGILVFAAAPMLHMAAMIWVIEDYKDVLYPALGIEYERDVPNDFQRLKVRSVKSQIYRLIAFALGAVGLYLEFVLAPSLAF
ncbi:hypothetical protein BRC81_10615 [Halobacteriales archaeon QS_1_68_20]|nr:MAG: hypothetical protein BRC81_10615 [Halobacteriales archaeon QS_1_68_20]